MTRSTSKITWVVMGPAPHFATCERCGEHEQAPRMPVQVDAFVRYMQYLCERHRYCEKEAEE